MNSASISSSSFDILNLQTYSQKISKENLSKYITNFNYSSRPHDHESINIFSDKPDKISFLEKNPIIANNLKFEKKLKKIKIPKFKCEFPFCQKSFISQSQLQRHEKSKFAHKKMIFNMVYKRCLNSNSPEELLHDEQLKEIYKYSPDTFVRIIKLLKKKNSE